MKQFVLKKNGNEFRAYQAFNKLKGEHNVN